MRKLGLSLLLLFFMQISSWAQEGTIEVVIKQNGKVIPIKKGVVKLKSSDFVFEITSDNLDSFLIGATFDRDLYRSALGEADLEVPWFQTTAIADHVFNPNRELIILDDAPNYWYYKNAKDHRFDRDPKGSKEHWTAQRSVHVLNDLLNYETIPLTKFKKSIFLYFYTPIYDENYNLKETILLYSAELKFN